MSADKKISSNQAEDWLGLFNRSVIWLPLLVFIALAVAVIFSAVTFQTSNDNNVQQTIQQLVKDSQQKTISRLEAYSLVSRSGVGLLQAGPVSNDTWNRHLKVFEPAATYPSIWGIGYGGIGLSQAGDASPATTSLSLQYIYPQLPQTDRLIGMDITADAEWASAIAATARTGQETMTDVFNLVPGLTDSDDPPKGFLLFTPVYASDQVPQSEAERLDQFRGVVFVAFNAEKFFEQIYGQRSDQLSYLKIYQGDSSNQTVLYENGQHPPAEDRISYGETVEVFGREVTYEYEFSNRALVPNVQRFIAQALPVVGLVLSLLLSIVIAFSLKSRNQRLSFTREREIQSAKDELLSLASHQLRTPATGVKQYMGMVLQGFAGDISDQQRDFLERAYASNERQLHVINDILYLAKLDAGRIVLTKTEFDLVELIDSVVDEQKDSAKQSDITIEVKTPKKAIAVADAHMFRMVLENLLTNAIKYTDQQGQVTVKLVRVGDNYTIAVSDTGVGIEPGDLDKLFKQFVRIPNQRSNTVTGTGVGLYLAKSLMQLHDGDIEVVSVPGQGSTFTIILPRGL